MILKIGSKILRGAAIAACVAFTAGEANAAVKCQLRLGLGCNGPVLYEMQLCAEVTFNQGHCVNLCEGTRPLCNVTNFDAWVSAYDDKGRHGIHGPLAESSQSDNFDQTGQLLATAGNTYTVCLREKVVSASLLGNVINSSYSAPRPASNPVQCPGAIIAGPGTCGPGTVFNNDPGNPLCVTQNSYCGGGGSMGNFASTMLAGNQMVAVQNEHFIVHASEDPNLHQSASVAGTTLGGQAAPSAASGIAPFVSSNPSGRGSKAGGAVTGSSGALGGGGSSANGLSGAGTDSSLASKSFAMEGGTYGGSGSGGGAGAGNGAGAGSGTSWFGAGSAATAGTAGEGMEFGNGDAASRGLASTNAMNVEDPENYFLMSDVAVSLFKRVTAQCRKKERSLVLAP